MDNSIDDECKIIDKALNDFYYNCRGNCRNGGECLIDDDYRQMQDKLKPFFSYIQSVSAEIDQLKAICSVVYEVNSLQKKLEDKKNELDRLLVQKRPFENKISEKNDENINDRENSPTYINGVKFVETCDLEKYSVCNSTNQFEDKAKDETDSSAFVRNDIIKNFVEKFNGDEYYPGKKIILSEEDASNRDRSPKRFTSLIESQKLVFVESSNYAKFSLFEIEEDKKVYFVTPQRHYKITRNDVFLYAYEDVFILEGYKNMLLYTYILEKPAIFERIEEGKYKLLVRGKLKLQPIEE